MTQSNDHQITPEEFIEATVDKLLELDLEAIDEEDYETSEKLQKLASELLGIEPPGKDE